MTDEVLTAEISPPVNESLRDTITRAVESQREAAPVDDTPKSPPVAREPIADKPKDQPQDRSRDELGRFAKTDTPQQTPKIQEPTKAPASPAAEPAQDAPVAAAGPKAPVGWPADAKAEFAKLPPNVQQAVARREEEVNRGFAVLQKYKGLEEYDPYLQANGTTHADVMKRALAWEKSLVSDPVGTIRHAMQASGHDPRAILQALINPNATPAPRPQPVPMLPRIDVQAEIEKAFRARETQSSVEKFMSDPKNEHAETVADAMAALIQAGRASSLEDAYQQAIWAHPDIRETLINQRIASSAPSNGARQQQAAAQARNAAKAVTGAPSGGKAPPGAGAEPKSTRDAIRMAIDAQR